MAEQASISSTAPQDEKRVWYRGTLFNACIIGAVGFTAPGLWNAMNALGAGGAQEPFLINAANALVFGLSMLILLYMRNTRLADLFYSGLFVSFWWSNCQSHWIEMDFDAWCCWISIVLVRITNLGEPE
jgi:hypothetical protein